MSERTPVGNLYVNREITGAMVGRQPFGGGKLSGTGPKAGGPDYLLQFVEARAVTENTVRHGLVVDGIPSRIPVSAPGIRHVVHPAAPRTHACVWTTAWVCAGAGVVAATTSTSATEKPARQRPTEQGTWGPPFFGVPGGHR